MSDPIEARCRICGETTTYYDGNDAREFDVEHLHRAKWVPIEGAPEDFDGGINPNVEDLR